MQTRQSLFEIRPERIRVCRYRVRDDGSHGLLAVVGLLAQAEDEGAEGDEKETGEGDGNRFDVWGAGLRGGRERRDGFRRGGGTGLTERDDDDRGRGGRDCGSGRGVDGVGEGLSWERIRGRDGLERFGLTSWRERRDGGSGGEYFPVDGRSGDVIVFKSSGLKGRDSGSRRMRFGVGFEDRRGGRLGQGLGSGVNLGGLDCRRGGDGPGWRGEGGWRVEGKFVKHTCNDSTKIERLTEKIKVGRGVGLHVVSPHRQVERCVGIHRRRSPTRQREKIAIQLKLEDRG
jgi:hypothetical protein